jgi:hypothetical protein
MSPQKKQAKKPAGKSKTKAELSDADLKKVAGGAGTMRPRKEVTKEEWERLLRTGDFDRR